MAESRKATILSSLIIAQQPFVEMLQLYLYLYHNFCTRFHRVQQFAYRANSFESIDDVT
ncbi:MAG: hypothetical protein IEMM0008_1324 [bacterium]|nr:MAG: hypothetical protein IEMM0008_1324 [bacterium]